MATLLVFSALLGTGLLLEFVLGHGQGKAWLGLGRHDWGTVHFWLALGLVALVVTHLIQHRAWIAKCWSRFAGSLRSPLTWVLVGLSAALIALPLLIPPEAGPGRGSRGQHRFESGDVRGPGFGGRHRFQSDESWDPDRRRRRGGRGRW